MARCISCWGYGFCPTHETLRSLWLIAVYRLQAVIAVQYKSCANAMFIFLTIRKRIKGIMCRILPRSIFGENDMVVLLCGSCHAQVHGHEDSYDTSNLTKAALAQRRK